MRHRNQFHFGQESQVKPAFTGNASAGKRFCQMLKWRRMRVAAGSAGEVDSMGAALRSASGS
jgi:hypothetical protein